MTWWLPGILVATVVIGPYLAWQAARLIEHALWKHQRKRRGGNLP